MVTLESDKKLMELANSEMRSSVYKTWDNQTLVDAVPILLKRIEALRAGLITIRREPSSWTAGLVRDALSADERMAEGK